MVDKSRPSGTNAQAAQVQSELARQQRQLKQQQAKEEKERVSGIRRELGAGGSLFDQSTNSKLG